MRACWPLCRLTSTARQSAQLRAAELLTFCSTAGVPPLDHCAGHWLGPRLPCTCHTETRELYLCLHAGRVQLVRSCITEQFALDKSTFTAMGLLPHCLRSAHSVISRVCSPLLQEPKNCTKLRSLHDSRIATCAGERQSSLPKVPASRFCMKVKALKLLSMQCHVSNMSSSNGCTSLSKSARCLSVAS